jgi:hypothetical protein
MDWRDPDIGGRNRSCRRMNSHMDKQQTGAPALDANHRRSISISLRLLDKALCEWERWADGEVCSGVLYQQKDTLSSGEKKQLRSEIANVRASIVQVRNDLDLESEILSTAQLIVAQANVLWEMLAELNSRSLVGYGNVAEDLANYIDPVGEKFAEAVNRISRLFSRAN